MPIDHIGFAVSNTERSKQFYIEALAPLGLEFIGEDHGWVGFGKNGIGDIWLGTDKKVQHPMHVAFLADNRKQVDQFYESALQAGAKDNGKPGIRTEYHPNYYGAFVIDPDGHNIEAVCHHEESE